MNAKHTDYSMSNYTVYTYRSKLLKTAALSNKSDSKSPVETVDPKTNCEVCRLTGNQSDRLKSVKHFTREVYMSINKKKFLSRDHPSL